MINDQQRADFDQTRATMEELMPPLWKGLFDGMIREGFTKDEALRILGDYIIASCTPQSQ